MANEWNKDFGKAEDYEERISTSVGGDYDYFLRGKDKNPGYLTALYTTWVLSGKTMALAEAVRCKNENIDVQLRYTCGDWPGRVNGVGLYFTNETYQEFVTNEYLHNLAYDMEMSVSSETVEEYIRSKSDIEAVRKGESEKANSFTHMTGADPLGLKEIVMVPEKGDNGGDPRRRHQATAEATEQKKKKEEVSMEN